MTIAQQSTDAEAAPSNQSLRALDGFNFFVGGALAGFGPFVTVFLKSAIWLVGTKVAIKNHAEFINNMELIDAMPPGSMV